MLDDLSTGRRANIEHLVATGAVDLIETSVTDAEVVDTLMAGCDCCLHLASTVGVQLVVAEPLEALRRIVFGADVVISAAARRNKRLIPAKSQFAALNGLTGLPQKWRGNSLAYRFWRER